MHNDIRVYNYDDNEPLITRMAQIKSYLDKKFAESQTKVDFSEVHEHLNQVDEDVKAIHFDVDLSEVNQNIEKAKNEVISNTESCKEEIIEKIEDSKPCLCKLATKEDVCHIITHIENSKKEIIEEIDEKFVNLNDLVK